MFGAMVWIFSTICQAYCIFLIFEATWLRGSATQLIPRNGEAKELCRDQTVKPPARVRTAEPKIDLH